MNRYFPYFLILLLGEGVGSFSQLLLKKEAGKEHTSFLRQYLNGRVISAYSLLLLSTVFSLIAFRILPLGLSPIAEALSQILTVTLSVVFLKERMTKKKILGFTLIIIGMVVMIV